MFLLILLTLFCILCFVMGWTILGVILVVNSIILGIIYIITDKRNQKNRIERKLRQIEINRQIQAEKERKELDYINEKNILISKYGQIDKEIILGEFNIQKEIIVFGNVNRILIFGKDILMSDIISCTFSDDKRVNKGKVSYETKTSTGNMAKRAVIGSVLLGGAGAVICGSTASKNTIVKQEDDTIIHNYTVIININSLSDPIIKINLGSDEDKVNEVIGLMNVIINRK